MCPSVCMCMHVHVYVSHLHLASRTVHKLTPDSCSLSVWLPITIFPAVFQLHSLCAAKLHCFGTIQWNPSGIFVLIVIVCPKSVHMVTKGDKPLCLLCLGLLAGGLREGNGGQQLALCFKMSGLRQHKPVLLTFGKVRPDLEFRGYGERKRCKAKSSDGIKYKNLCHLPTPINLWFSPRRSLHWTREGSCAWKQESFLLPAKPIQTGGGGVFCNPCLLSDQALDVSTWHPHPPANCRRSTFWCHVNTAMKVRIKFLLEGAVGTWVNIARHKKGRSRSVQMHCSPASHDAGGELMLLQNL